MINILLI